MEILKLDLSRLRNEEHYNYHSEVNALVQRFTAEALGIQSKYPAYEAAFAAEGEVLDVVQKSIFTGPIAEADQRRDSLVAGIERTIAGALLHFSEDVREAARRLKIVFNSFGDIRNKGYNEETAAIKTLVADLETTHDADVASVGITDWVAELKTANTAFETLINERYTAEAAKDPLKMKDARRQLDEAYREVTRLLDALVLVNGTEAYEAFIKELNKRIEKYTTIADQRQGRNKKEEDAPGETV